ncbi:MAG TPA: sialidase family protein [Verrucomicrobiae bacterium]|nr:sialidase family protein [Verrucomicrobiae bacterium]
MKMPVPVWFCLLSTVWFLTGCDKLANQPDQNWAPPVAVTSSIDSLAGKVTPYKCLDSIIALQVTKDMSARCLLMRRGNDNSNFWVEVPLPSIISQGYAIDPTVEQSDGKILFSDGHATNNQLTISILFAQLKENGTVQIETERKWITDKQSLFGVTGTNVSLNGPSIGTGNIHDKEICLPYCLTGDTLTDAVRAGPFNNGVFHSVDSGATWQMEQISDFEAGGPTVCRAENYYYYIAISWLNNAHELWFSQKATEGGAWSAPKSVTKTFAKELGNYTAMADGDTVHLCWMDCRHNKWRFDLSGPAIENDDIYYSHRKDSDNSWSKDVILSKGVLYCYAPSISAEGDKVVVVWAGIPSAGRYHTDYDPNDIFYVTSKDGGNTWTKPLKVTDGAKDGMTAGHPQVVLLNGVIHLFYIQGKMDLQQVGGMTKLNQPPWPIYYTQRPFPN